MKALFFLFVLVLTPFRGLLAQSSGKTAEAFSLPVDNETGQIIYTTVVEVPGAKQSELYSRAELWVAQASNSVESNVRFQNPSEGVLVVKRTERVTYKAGDAGTVSYILALYCTDGKYKYVLKEFNHAAPRLSQYVFASGGPLEAPNPKISAPRLDAKVWAAIKQETATNAQRLVASLTNAMSKKVSNDF